MSTQHHPLRYGIATVRLRTGFKTVVQEINYINHELLHPEAWAWGKMTPNQADDSFNNVDNHGINHYYDWGNKSMNILEFVKGNGNICGENSPYFCLAYTRNKNRL